MSTFAGKVLYYSFSPHIITKHTYQNGTNSRRSRISCTQWKSSWTFNETTYQKLLRCIRMSNEMEPEKKLNRIKIDFGHKVNEQTFCTSRVRRIIHLLFFWIQQQKTHCCYESPVKPSRSINFLCRCFSSFIALCKYFINSIINTSISVKITNEKPFLSYVQQ